MKFPGIDEKTFAICVCCLAVVAASSDRWIWPLLCVGAVVVAIARFADARRKRIQREHTSIEPLCGDAFTPPSSCGVLSKGYRHR